METLNEQEKDLVIDAVNQYWHQASNELQKKDLGDIERKNWESIKTKCGDLFRKLNEHVQLFIKMTDYEEKAK